MKEMSDKGMKMRLDYQSRPHLLSKPCLHINKTHNVKQTSLRSSNKAGGQ